MDSQQTGPCACLIGTYNHLIRFRELGMDSRFAEVSILVCPNCGQYWLRYFYEVEAFANSGRWYLGPLAEEQASALGAEDAKNILEGLDWYYYGGSYYHGRNGKRSGSIFLNP